MLYPFHGEGGTDGLLGRVKVVHLPPKCFRKSVVLTRRPFPTVEKGRSGMIKLCSGGRLLHTGVT